jgi:hypothetical protein
MAPLVSSLRLCCSRRLTCNTSFNVHVMCHSPTTTKSLNDASAGTGTSTTDWVDLVVGEGGVIDWVVPGWRGEYKN